jgi:hypothetical protein
MSSEQYFEQLWKDALEKYFASTDETTTRKALLKQINTADDFQNHLEQLATPDDLKRQLQADQDKFQTFRNQHGQYLLQDTLKDPVVLGENSDFWRNFCGLHSPKDNTTLNFPSGAELMETSISRSDLPTGKLWKISISKVLDALKSFA